MHSISKIRCAALVALSALLNLLAGCGSELDRYTPTAIEAKTSLEAALSAWRDGKPYGPIEATPRIQVADSAWQAGEQVESFSIGEEKDEGDGTKQFVVALKMKSKKATEEQSVRYFVHGRDPVWVYREEDYKRMIGMENNPVPKSSSKSGARSTARRK